MSRTRSISLLAVVAAAGTLVPLSAPASAGAAASCTSRGGTTVIATREARVFAKAKRINGQRVTPTYACDQRTRRITRLDRPELADPIRTDRSRYRPRLAGRFVGYYNELIDPAGASAYSLQVLDIRSRRLLDQRGGGVGNREVRGPFVIKRNGSIAWTMGRDDGTTVELTIDDSGGERLADSGSVELESLALSADRTRVTWVNAGTVREAAIR
jgi:hypothetical protein